MIESAAIYTYVLSFACIYIYMECYPNVDRTPYGSMVTLFTLIAYLCGSNIQAAALNLVRHFPSTSEHVVVSKQNILCILTSLSNPSQRCQTSPVIGFVFCLITARVRLRDESHVFSRGGSGNCDLPTMEFEVSTPVRHSTFSVSFGVADEGGASYDGENRPSKNSPVMMTRYRGRDVEEVVSGT